jgi:hypothetical protein
VVVTTNSVVEEIKSYLPEFARRYSIELDLLNYILELLPVERYAESHYASHVQRPASSSVAVIRTTST